MSSIPGMWSDDTAMMEVKRRDDDERMLWSVLSGETVALYKYRDNEVLNLPFVVVTRLETWNNLGRLRSDDFYLHTMDVARLDKTGFRKKKGKKKETYRFNILSASSMVITPWAMRSDSKFLRSRLSVGGPPVRDLRALRWVASYRPSMGALAMSFLVSG